MTLYNWLKKIPLLCKQWACDQRKHKQHISIVDCTMIFARKPMKTHLTCAEISEHAQNMRKNLDEYNKILQVLSNHSSPSRGFFKIWIINQNYNSVNKIHKKFIK